MKKQREEKNIGMRNQDEGENSKKSAVILLLLLMLLVLAVVGIYGCSRGNSKPVPVPTPNAEVGVTTGAEITVVLFTPTPSVSPDAEPTGEVSPTKSMAPTEEVGGTPTEEPDPTNGAEDTPTPTPTQSPETTGKPTVTPPKTPTPTKKPVSTPTPTPSSQAKYVYVIEATKLNENPQYYTPGKQCDVAHGTKLESLGKVGSGYYTKVRYNGGIWYVPTECIGNAYLSPTPTIAVGAYLSKEMLTLVNAARAEEGLRPYSWGKDLEALALKRATHLYTVAQTDEFQNGDYETQRKLGHAGGWTEGCEIMHIGYDSSAADALYGWKLSSHGHWKIVVSSGTEDYVIGTDEDGNPVTIVMPDGTELHTGDMWYGTPVRMAAAYYVDKYGDTYWVLVTAREDVQYNP